MSKNAARVIDWLLALSFALALSAYAYLGSYSRYMADDYTALTAVRMHGFLGVQITWYRAWTGRFAFTFVNSLVALLGPVTPRLMPGLLLTLWFAATVWAIYRLHSLSGRISWPRVVLFAGFVIFATVETAPNVSQSLYWQTGALTYVAPFIPLSLYVGVLSGGMSARHKHSSYRFNLSCAGILTFVAGGLSDAYVVLQTCGLILSILAVEIFAGVEFKSRIRGLLIAGLVGSLLALTIVAAAPGNSIRQTYFPKRFHGWDIFGVTVLYSVYFVGKLVLTHPTIVLASLTLPLLIVLRDRSHSDEPTWNRLLCIRLLWMIPIAVFLLIMCCTASSVYAISVMLPERARILLGFTFICGTVVWSRAAGEYLAGELLAKNRKIRQIISLVAMVALLLLTLSPQISFFSTLGTREEARSFAADWNRQDLELKTAKQSGATDVTVRQIGDFQSRIGKGASDLHLRTDPAFWINQTTADYYGLRSVRAREDVSISH